MIEIIKLESGGHDADKSVRAFVDRALGDGYFDSMRANKKHLLEWIAFQDKYPVGWAAISLDEDVPVLQSIAVHEDYRGLGIGDGLVKVRVDFLTEQGYRFVRAHAWTTPSGACNSCRLLERNKFYCTDTWSDYYSGVRNCPHCGAGNQCKCLAQVYCRSL